MQFIIAEEKKAVIEITDANEGVIRSIDLAFFANEVIDVNYDDGVVDSVKIISINN